MTARTPIRIHLDALLNAIEDHCGFTHYYLDRETGEIIFQSEHLCADDIDGCPEADSPYPNEDIKERFVHIEPMDGSRGKGIMAGFINTLPGGMIKSKLAAAAEKRTPYRKFKDVLRDHPETEAKWQKEFCKEIKIIAMEWLSHNNINYEFYSYRDALKHDG
jgi:hypothetical protein